MKRRQIKVIAAEYIFSPGSKGGDLFLVKNGIARM